jgi:hypothetical protein
MKLLCPACEALALVGRGASASPPPKRFAALPLDEYVCMDCLAHWRRAPHDEEVSHWVFRWAEDATV